MFLHGAKAAKHTALLKKTAEPPPAVNNEVSIMQLQVIRHRQIKAPIHEGNAGPQTNATWIIL